MNVDVKTLAKVPNAVFTVEERISQKGNVYKVCCVTINGSKIQLGFFGDREELQLLKAGVKISE